LQARPAHVRIDAGREHIGCVRLSDKGMFRFYATCCQTALGNVMSSPSMPFVAISRRALEGDDAVFPPVMGIMGKFAIGTPPPGTAASIAPMQAMQTMLFVAKSALARAGKPHAYFDDAGAPIVPPRVLTPAEREALRARDREQ